MKNANLFDKMYWTCALLLIFSQKANAYLDPGTGSMLVQIFIATFAGVIYAVKLQWNNLKTFVKSIITGKGKNEQ